MREKNLKINSWASPSPADWHSGGLWVRFKFVVATAAGQGTEGESERGRFSALDAGALWGWEPDILYPHTLGKHLEEALFLEAVT